MIQGGNLMKKEFLKRRKYLKMRFRGGEMNWFWLDLGSISGATA